MKGALNTTEDKRGSKAVFEDYRKIMDTVRNSEIMKKQWDNYQNDYEYAMVIAFKDICDIIIELLDKS